MNKMLACLLISLASVSQAFAKGSPKSQNPALLFCAQDVIENAKKLFLLHYGTDDSVRNGGAFFSEVKVQPPVQSPDGKRKYKTFETIAHIGKMGQYRIRMIYAQLGTTDPQNDCILMGQEILDLSAL